jgi:hypothetical protein
MTANRIKLFEQALQRDHPLERAEDIFQESPPLLREKVEWIRSSFEEEWRRSITFRYQAAVLIKEIYDDVNQNNGATYGAKAVQAIKLSFGWDDGVIYQALHVAEAFTPEQIQEVAQMRSPEGKPVSFSHVVALSRVEDDGKRQKLLCQAVREAWTSKKLANAVEMSSVPPSGKQQDRRGRPFAVPKSFDSLLDQQRDFARDFLERNSAVWTHAEHSLSTRAGEMLQEDMTEERLARLKQHAAQMSLLAKKAQERADEAMKVHKSFVRVLKERAGKQKKIEVVVAGAPSQEGGA